MSIHANQDSKSQTTKKFQFWKPLLIFIICIIVIVLGVNFWMSSKVPKSKGTLVLEGLKDEVEVHNDEFGVPHIFAKNEDDLYLAFGYVHASERLFQMEIMRRVVGGRLSELLGPKLIKTDKLFRSLGFKRNSEKWLNKYESSVPPEVTRAVDQYVKGLNYFLKKGPLPVEFAILGIGREEFAKSDIFGMAAYMGYSFAEAFNVDPVITSLEKEYGAIKIAELTKDDPTFAPIIVDDSQKISLAISSSMTEIRSTLEEHGIPMLEGSNSWAISPKKTKSGQAIIANDPHIGYANPSVWFEAYLNTPNFDIYGHFLALTPFAVIGFNKDFAWTLTMFENDDMDFYKETLNPNNSNQIMFQGKPENIQTTEELIKVKGEEPVKLIVKESRHGVFLNEIADSLLDEKNPIALRWNMFDANNKIHEAMYKMNHSKDMKYFESALSHLKAPGLNIVYADKKGNIAFWAAGGLFEKNFPTDRILDGTSGKFEWGREIPFSQNPHSINPPAGIIVTANNRPASHLGYRLNGYWQADDRGNRINALLRQNKKWDLEDMKEVIIDTYFEGSDFILNPFFSLIKLSEDKLTKREKETLEILQKWDRQGNKNEAGGAVFSELRYQLAREMFADEMGEERFKFLASTNRIFHYFKWAYLNEKSSWWDNIHTPEKDTPKDIVYRALGATTLSLLGKLDKNPKNWKWGRLSKLELSHPIGSVPPMNLIFNSKTLPVSGGAEVINNIKSKFHARDFKPSSGPSMRRLIDFSKMDEIAIIGYLGQSGHRKSKHFQNQMKMYVDGRFRTISLDKMKNSDPNDRLVLKPN
ncbi:MAG: penicillin acylase family protein [Leptospiraceae bacterium]|nr:penicillin acylase family protein [Leptospiraceae bacterium]MCK6382222.1 penicillin acylase family protein [Leptospiraceae bacterium]NUM41617.1 penicillin acylase family protein [Leptospiraceae bacterium]